MALKSRQEIKPSFQNGVIPTAQDFGHLIDSMLNKRDDKFHGAWKPGVLYYEGEVVIYGKTMYLLYNPATGKPSAAAKTTAVSKSPQTQPSQGSTTTPFSWCSTCPPPDDPEHWCQLQFDFEDKDWSIEPTFIYAHKDVEKVGIGINQGTATNAQPSPPQAKLHIYQESRGQFKFNPDTPADRTEFRMESCNQPSNCGDKPYLSQYLDADFTHFETNAKDGFSFDYPLPVTPPTDPVTIAPQPLMVVTGSAKEPEVGIGTSEPTASLQVTDPGVGDFQVNPTGSPDPLLVLKNLVDDSCIEVTVHHDFADLKTNATEGFRFGPKEVAKPAAAVAAKSVAQNLDSVGVTGGTSQVVVVDVDRGYVGIGTEQPTTRLEVTDQKLGSIQLSVDEATPSLVLLNFEDTLDKSTIFAAGVDNANAILQTDAGCGFVFRIVEQSELNLRPDINAGEDVVFIDNKGNTGIQRPPGDYQLDVDGSVRQYENYVPHNKTTMDNQRTLEHALDIVCSLTPLRFTWKNNLDAASNLKPGDHFGFKETDVEQYAKEVCKVV
ncbi:MAG: hypothetical protein AAB316_14680, partial [Bacteroidota bacterium]